MNEKEQIRQYLQLFDRLCQQTGKLTKIMLIILIALLIFFQAALRIHSLRPFISPVDRLDGIPVERSGKDWHK
ncbi:hypothetical protein [Paenibacillus sp.]|jgi:flagellar biosynthesis/type III secretory pathway M-ring protein FliF/YscJ|uniref:hypothetical protein n=1 Tax=Paenibacillus sp. TaxID=58172 RepID=UPI002829CDD7|nr:hypothetical protein [Paenibacillus sp.]MDR0270286.1 hypothetical protein [Paenibacillus sp.]